MHPILMKIFCKIANKKNSSLKEYISTFIVIIFIVIV